MLIVVTGCRRDETNKVLKLTNYLAESKTVLYDKVIACAAGSPFGISGSNSFETSVFFYPVPGASDFKYFEAEYIKDSMSFNKYIEKRFPIEPVFNGYLKKFIHPFFNSEKMGVVTYVVDGVLYLSTPIRLKTNVKPTEVNANLLLISEDGISPSFSWQDGKINENVIYFQVISDLSGNFICGTYTLNKEFTFYDLNNVVLNVTELNTTPQLIPNSIYNFTMMAVSEDNWVNLMFQSPFQTN